MWIDDAMRRDRAEPSYEPSIRRLVRWIDTGIQATRFTFAHPRRWSNGCGKHRRRGWSVFPFEQAALAMIPAEHTENVQSFAGLSTFSPVANKQGEA